MREVRPILALLTVVILAACGSSGASDEPDASIDAPASAACADLGPGSLGELDSVTTGLEIHPVAQFDGDAIWLAYTINDSESSSVFDTAVLRLDCDGAPLGAPVRATTTGGRNEIDPVIAIGADSIAVAWTSDAATATDNLDIVIRAFDRDGTPMTDSDITLEPQLADGTPVTGNSWYPALAARPDGSFILAGSAARPGGLTFRAFAHALAADGTPTGALLELDEPGDLLHSELSVATAADDSIWFAWAERDGDIDTVMTTTMAPGAGAPATPATAMLADDQSSAPNLTITGSGARLAAVRTVNGNESDITLVAGTSTATIGTAGALDHTPIVAMADDDSGAVAYFRNLGGFRNQLVIVGFTLGAGGIELGEPIEIAHEIAAPPYQPTITALRDGIYFVAWAEGMSPNFSIRGELLAP